MATLFENPYQTVTCNATCNIV